MTSNRLDKETVAQMRGLFETAELAIRAIAARCGVSEHSVRRYARLGQWQRAGHREADPPPAPRPSRQRARSRKPAERHALLMRLYAGLEAQIREYERRLIDETTAERDIKHLSGMAATLERLAGIEKALGPQIHAQEGRTRTIEELRAKLAERLAKLYPAPEATFNPPPED